MLRELRDAINALANDERIIASSRTWMRLFANVFVVVEGTVHEDQIIVECDIESDVFKSNC